MDQEAHDARPHEAASRSRVRAGPALYALVGVVAGVVVGFVLAWVIGSNPFSTTNEIVYRELTVASVSEDADRICWADDPDRRDSPLECAILGLDPRLPVPEEGDRVMAAVVDVRTPDGAEFRQVVHVAQPGAAGEPVETDDEES